MRSLYMCSSCACYHSCTYTHAIYTELCFGSAAVPVSQTIPWCCRFSCRKRWASSTCRPIGCRQFDIRSVRAFHIRNLCVVIKCAGNSIGISVTRNLYKEIYYLVIIYGYMTLRPVFKTIFGLDNKNHIPTSGATVCTGTHRSSQRWLMITTVKLSLYLITTVCVF